MPPTHFPSLLPHFDLQHLSSTISTTIQSNPQRCISSSSHSKPSSSSLMPKTKLEKSRLDDLPSFSSSLLDAAYHSLDQKTPTPSNAAFHPSPIARQNIVSTMNNPFLHHYNRNQNLINQNQNQTHDHIPPTATTSTMTTTLTPPFSPGRSPMTPSPIATSPRYNPNSSPMSPSPIHPSPITSSPMTTLPLYNPSPSPMIPSPIHASPTTSSPTTTPPRYIPSPNPMTPSPITTPTHQFTQNPIEYPVTLPSSMVTAHQPHHPKLHKPHRRNKSECTTGHRLAECLNTLCSSASTKKKAIASSSSPAVTLPPPTLPVASSTRSSHSRPSVSRPGTAPSRRSVRFSPVSVILDEDYMRWKQNAAERREEEVDDDQSSDSSSDLFELESLTTIAGGDAGELPVYEATRFAIPRPRGVGERGFGDFGGC